MPSTARISAWLPWVISVQLLLVFFAPPIDLGGRRLYLSDVWCAIWVLAGVVFLLRADAKAASRYWSRFFIITAAALLAVFLHGTMRPLLRESLDLYFPGIESDSFNIGREVIVAFRFLSWLWAGALAVVCFRSDVFESERSRLIIVKALWFCLAGVVVLMFLGQISQPFLELLGRIYRYDPYSDGWAGRAFGTIPSPVESGVVLGFAGGLFLFHEWIPAVYRFSGIAIAIAGVALARSGSGLVAVVCAVVLYLFAVAVRKAGRFKLAVGFAALAVIVAIVVVAILFPAFVGLKIAHLNGRVRPWGVLIQAALHRPDVFLLGVGFPSYHVDNSFLFLFNRGGLLFFGGFAWLFLQAAFYFSKQAVFEALPYVLLLVMGMATDVIIIRSVISVIIASIVLLPQRK